MWRREREFDTRFFRTERARFLRARARFRVGRGFGMNHTGTVKWNDGADLYASAVTTLSPMRDYYYLSRDVMADDFVVMPISPKSPVRNTGNKKWPIALKLNISLTVVRNCSNFQSQSLIIVCDPRCTSSLLLFNSGTGETTKGATERKSCQRPKFSTGKGGYKCIS